MALVNNSATPAGSHRRALAWALALAPLLWIDTGHAGPTAKWIVDGYEQWDEGEADQAFITSHGEVLPGWTTEHTDLEIGGTWAAVRGKGGELYVGTDDSGAIYRLRAGKADKLATIEDAVAVVSLALDRGTLYAGTMPGGQIWKVDASSGKASRLASIDNAETVWALAVDTRGTLFAGTGPDGVLYRVDPKTGKAQVAFKSEDKRILSLIATSDGAIWFGTSDDAQLFRHDPARKTTRAIADFPGNEVTALAEHKGQVIAAANDLKEPATSGVKSASAIEEAENKKKTKSKSSSKSKKPGTDKTPSGTEPARKGARKGKGTLFRVSGDGQTEELHALSESYFTAIAVTREGEIYAGAGDKGRIYRIGSDDSVSTAFDVSQRQIAQIVAEPGGGLQFLTGDSTSLYRTGKRASTATYMSKVFDADAAARFGSMSWRSSGKVEVETRSGNTEEPGPGWSSWEKVRDSYAAGGGGKRAKVVSPPGRYLQFRTKLGSDGAVRTAQLYYLPQNQPTRIDEIKIKPGASRNQVTLQQNGGTPRSPIIKLEWDVSNDDSDETTYKLFVRREGDVRWRRISTGSKPLTAAKYDWNTETYPDGYYRLRVLASDNRANPDGRAIETSKISSVFVVDNQRPDVGNVTVRYPNASVRATDSLSPLTEMSWSIDDGTWHVGAPRDRIFDDTTELLAIELPSDLSPGVHTLAIRVADEAGNIGSTAVTFRVD